MAEARIETPFGPATLRSPVGAAGPVGPKSVELPSGLSVDGCLAGEIEVAFSAGETVAFEFGCDLVPGASASSASGEKLAAWEVEAPGLAGCFAMRDLDLFEERHGFEIVSYANAAAGFAFRLRSSRTFVLRVPLAAAWKRTSVPPTNEDAVAPWFAVDRALPF